VVMDSYATVQKSKKVEKPKFMGKRGNAHLGTNKKYEDFLQAKNNDVPGILSSIRGRSS
jgi:hypothetical protein